MTNLISKFFYKLIVFLNFIIEKLFKRKNFRFYIYELLRNNNIKKILNNKITIFFCPSSETKRRIDTILTKEPETIDFINNFVKIKNKDKNKDLIFFDIGSNIGLYSIYASQVIDKIKVYSFEPSFNNLSILSKNISMNNLNEKIFIMPFSVTEKKESRPFFPSNFYETMDQEGGAINYFGEINNLFVDSSKNKNNFLTYSTFGTSLDDLIEEKIIPFPDVIKIDTDGQELKILRGSRNLLKNCRTLKLQIELNEKDIAHFDESLKILKANEFVFLKKLRNDEYHKNEKFSEVYNYYFEKKETRLNVN